MTCTYATWDGSYVLGALSPLEREEFERHVVDCPTCAEAVRRLAGLPGLLSRVSEHALTEPRDPAEPAPETLLPRLVREVRRERRRRGLVASGLAAAAVVTVVAGALGVAARTGSEAPTAGPPASGSTSVGSPAPGTDPAPGARAMTPVGAARVQGWLTLETVPWGTRLTLECTYGSTAGGYGGADPAGYVLVVRTRGGGEQEVATWRGVPGRSMQLAAATATGRAEIVSVEVRADDGRPVLRLQG